MKSQITNHKSQKNLFFILVFILSVVLIFEFIKTLRNSFFLKKRDRVNVVFYGQETAFYSLGFGDVDYFVYFSPDEKILIPGGFKDYRLGALGKLVNLEKKPAIFQHAFSIASSSFVDFYFYPAKTEIYYGNDQKNVFFPKITSFFLAKTNANWLERIYVCFLFSQRQVNQFRQIKNPSFKDSVGNFYQKTYRNERAAVQILYTKNENNAKLLSQIIEGQGIRVSDYSLDLDGQKNCQILVNSKTTLESAKAIGDFFHCPVFNRTIDAYDIIFKLGVEEENWAIE